MIRDALARFKTLQTVTLTLIGIFSREFWTLHEDQSEVLQENVVRRAERIGEIILDKQENGKCMLKLLNHDAHADFV